MKHIIRICQAIGTLTVLSALPAFGGGSSGTDTFDTFNNWVSGSPAGNGSLTISNGAAHYTVSTGTANDGVTVTPSLNGNKAIVSDPYPAFTGSVTNDWSVKVDVHMKTGLGGGNNVGAAINIMELQSANFSKGLMFSTGDAWGARRSILNNWGIGQWLPSDNLVPAPDLSAMTDSTLMVSYSAGSKMVSLSLLNKNNSATYDFGSFSAVTGWGMDGSLAGSAFGIRLSLYSSTVAIPEGDFYLDNFVYTGLDSNGVWPAVSAVPEPSTYAAIMGVAALGVGALRKRKKKAQAAEVSS